MKTLKCIDCEQDREIGRTRCRECYLRSKRENAKKRYTQHGRYTYQLTCSACNKVVKAWSKEQKLCKECYILSRKKYSINNYVYSYDEIAKKGGHLHRRIVEEILNRKLTYNEVVHHLDFNVQNNEMNNLIVLSRKIHGKLHVYLELQRVIIEKSMNENFENCWKNLIVPMTTAWLEITNANVIKIWEIGQSAAEHLNPNGNDEGSETMHETSKPEMVDEDIVQTTTEKVNES